jgi:hypothetical protein
MFRYAGKDSYLKNLEVFEPDCPFLFIYGSLSPIDSFSRKWTEKMEKNLAIKLSRLRLSIG